MPLRWVAVVALASASAALGTYTSSVAITLARWAKNSSNSASEVLPERAASTSAFTPIWKTGMSSCARYSDDAFGVVVCLTQSSWSKCAGSTSWNQRCTHVVNVLYQLLDNDGDGAADDPALLSYMIREQYMCAESPLSSALRSALPGLELSCPRLQDEDPPQRE